MTIAQSIKETFKDTNINDPGFDLKAIFSPLGVDDDIAEIRKWAESKGVPADKFNIAYRRWRIIKEIGEHPRDVEHYIELFAKSRDLTVRFDGTITGNKLGRRPDAGSVERDIRLLAVKLGLPERISKTKHISDAFNKFISASKDARFDAVLADINAAGQSEPMLWKALAESIVDTNQVSAGYAIAVLQSMIWQVKRKMAADPSFPVSNHLMPILTGAQGAGKSTMARMFFSPIGDLMYCGDFAQITDKSNFEIWRFPVVFCDEMERAERSDVEAVKNAITSETRTGRTLYSNNVSTRRNDATFFGATNGTLGEKIVDTTGLRRFAPIPVKPAPTDENKAAGIPVADWEALSGIDWTALWRSVDYKAAHPLQSDPEARAEWLLLIEGERAQDSVELWLRQFDAYDSEYKGKELYPDYADFCKESGMSPCANNTLGRRMRSAASAQAPWFPFHQPVVKNGVVVWKVKKPAAQDRKINWKELARSRSPLSTLVGN